MTQIIDRRLNGKNKSAVNRTRFIRRFKGQIKKAVSDAVARRGVTEIDQGGKVNIPARDISEPIFGHGAGGRRSVIHAGNREFVAGDRIPRPPKGQGGGGGRASNTGEGEDDFIFEISREEFLEFFFDDLALPNLVKTQLNAVNEFTRVRAGFTPTGSPSDLNIIRSLRGAIGRRIALRSPYLAEVEALESELAELADEESERALQLKREIDRIKSRIHAIPFLDSFDLRYNNRVKLPRPATQAVMFCLMDVSGSMDQMKKDLAKRFFMLLYLFLKRSYEKIEVVFIRHHTIASEVGEEEFFYARETGGTVVSSALKLMREIIRDRFPTADWNIYAAQASDGDNWDDDSPLCEDLLITSIMPCLQYFAYIEIASEEEQNLWRRYLNVHAVHKNFAMQRIAGVDDIFPVFRELFKRQLVS